MSFLDFLRGAGIEDKDLEVVEALLPLTSDFYESLTRGEERRLESPLTTLNADSGIREALPLGFEPSASFVMCWLFKALAECGDDPFEMNDMAEEGERKICSVLTLSEPIPFEVDVEWEEREGLVYYEVSSRLSEAELKRKLEEREVKNAREQMLALIFGNLSFTGVLKESGVIDPSSFEDDIEDFLINRRKVAYSLVRSEG